MAAADGRAGPLKGLRVVEFVGIGPAPLCGMLLADLGAEVLRIDRQTPSGLGVPRPARSDLLARGRPSAAIDLKHKDGIALSLDLIAKADALIEGFRPGTMERLGLGPDICLERQQRLVYGRVTGWGQDGPLAEVAGHDLNYIAITGALHATGRAGAPPTPPLNLVGDYGGGGLLLAFGIVSALWEALRSGKGQVVDAAMIDGAAMLMTSFFGLHAAGLWQPERGTNIIDSGAPHYDVYVCADGEYVSIGPVEAKFAEVMLRRIGFDPATFPSLGERGNWPAARALLTARFAEKTRAEWCALLEGSESCFAPVLSMAEAPHHKHNEARGTFIDIDGVTQPAPAPRFSRTPAGQPTPPEKLGTSTVPALVAWGIDEARVAALEAAGVIGPAP